MSTITYNIIETSSQELQESEDLFLKYYTKDKIPLMESARLANVGLTRARRIAKDKGVLKKQNHTKKLLDTDLPECQRLREEGWTNKRIGEKYGVSHTCIIKRLKKYNQNKD